MKLDLTTVLCFFFNHNEFKIRVYLDAYGQIVLFDRLVVQRMVHLDVGPRETVVRPLLQVERVELVGLRRGTGHQPVEHRRIALDAGTENIETGSGLDAGRMRKRSEKTEKKKKRKEREK